MNKVNILANRLIKENKVKLYDTIGFSYPGARLKTLDTGIGHPIVYLDKLAPTVATNGAGGVVVKDENKNLRIRKLTPKECVRLMGFDDKDYEAMHRVNSDCQIYKQCGNSIVVNCLVEIFKNLLF